SQRHVRGAAVPHGGHPHRRARLPHSGRTEAAKRCGFVRLHARPLLPGTRLRAGIDGRHHSGDRASIFVPREVTAAVFPPVIFNFIMPTGGKTAGAYPQNSARTDICTFACPVPKFEKSPNTPVNLPNDARLLRL